VTYKVKISLKTKVPQTADSLNALLENVVLTAAAQIQEIAQTKMRGNPPAPEGGYPAVRTGLLRGTIGHRRIGPRQAMTYSPMEYAPHLEFGTVKMGARPFLRPSVDQVASSFRKAVATATSTAAVKAGPMSSGTRSGPKRDSRGRFLKK
jgi:hypothetical protein